MAPGYIALVGNTRGHSIARVDLTTGAVLEPLVPPGAHGLHAPDDIEIGPDGLLYVSSGCATGFAQRCDPAIPSQVLRFDPYSGEFKGSFASADDSPLYRPYGLAFAPDGTLFVSSFANEKILAYDGVTGAFLREVASAGPAASRQGGDLNGPNDLGFGSDGRLYVTTEGATNDGGVLRFPGLPSDVLRLGDQGFSLFYRAEAPPAGPAPSLVSVAFDDQGRLWATDYMSDAAFILGPDGTVVSRHTVRGEVAGGRPYTGDAEWAPGLGLLVPWGDDADVAAGALSLVPADLGPPKVIVHLGPALQRPLGVAVIPARP